MLTESIEEMSSDVLLPNIFVQIPSTNRGFSINSHRNSPNKASAEIKAEETIKSENDNGQVGNLHQQNDIRRRESSVEQRSDRTKYGATSNHNTNLASLKLVTARPKSSIKCFKCKQCPFISISAAGLDSHEKIHANGHDEGMVCTSVKPQRKKLYCPGCENVFYSRKPLKAHLLNDHQMSGEDTIVLLQSCITSPTTNSSKKSSRSSEHFCGQQKIYLKNVEVLKNPNPNPTAASTVLDDRCVEVNSVSSDSCLFSVDEERHQQDNTYIDLVETEGSGIENQESNLEARKNRDDYFCNKIYVRNVDNLNNQDSSEKCSYTNVNGCRLANSNSNTASSSPTILRHNSIDQQHNPQGNPAYDFGYPYNFEDNNADMSSIQDNLGVYNGSDDDRQNGWKDQQTIYSDGNDYVNTASAKMTILHNGLIATTATKDPNSYEYLRHFPMENCANPLISNDIGADYLATTTSVPSISIPLQRNERKKIFIKNIDILKKPIITTSTNSITNSRKSTLHLRTVDEVNLMLINKVHNENYYNNELASESVEPDSSNDLKKCENYNIDYEINDFVTNFEDDTLVVSPPLLNYFNTFPDNQINTDLFHHKNDNNIIILDEAVQPLETLNIDKTTDLIPKSVPDTIPLVTDKTENYQGNEYDRLSFQTGTNLIEPNDFIIVSSEEMINNCEDILDLTTDEVEQIFDENLMNSNIFNQSFGNLFSSRNKISKSIEYLGNPTENNMIAKFEETSSKSFSENEKAETAIFDENSGGNLLSIKRKGGRPKGTRKSYYSTSGEKIFTYKCKIEACSIRFASPTTLLFHEKCHTTSTKNGITCPKCDEEAEWNWNTLHTHLWRKHNIDMELYGCKECSFKTPILSRLNNTHMKIHSNVKEFKCDLCEKAFKNSKQLKNHRRIHAGRSIVHKCEFCMQSFYNVRYLKEHVRKLHEASEMDTFTCEICYKSFPTQQAYRNHHLTHFGEKKFHCSTCSYKSNDHNAFRRHQMTHNKEALYKCSACIFQCIQSTSYKSHILKKHPELAKDLIFSCNNCDFKTVNKKNFKVHQLKHGIELAQ